MSYSLLFLAESGRLFAFGSNVDSQLGIEGVQSCADPQAIESIETQQWKMLSAGSEHSLALTGQ